MDLLSMKCIGAPREWMGACSPVCGAGGPGGSVTSPRRYLRSGIGALACPPRRDESWGDDPSDGFTSYTGRIGDRRVTD